jgi:hypothetical protein
MNPADGTEIHNSQQLEDLGLGVAHGDQPTRSGVKVVGVPRAGWRRFFEYVPLERETGLAAPSAAYSTVDVRYRLAK